MDSAFAAMTGPQGPAVTFAPLLNNVVHLAAADLDACNTAADHVLDCADSLGGLTNVLNAPEEDLIACVCCSSGTLLADGYSSCYDYLTGAPGYEATDYEPYGVFYTVCNAQSSCGASSLTADTTEEDASMVTRPGYDEGPVTATAIIDVTTIASEDYLPTTTEPSECWDMISTFDSCEAETAGFATMPYAVQASCYCCGGSGQWTDEIDSSASVCAKWASTGEPYTVYPVATRFATFCEDYDDVCESKETGTATVTDAEKDNEPTETDAQDAEETTDNPDAAASVRVGYGAAAVAALALGMVI
ncbi:uncharacterized protein F5Z01DRAFT_271896 [Emericellopsis atlantica]|uniref:Uncharacterized protein n=1 Tax=Emericellopsis atlantica TaxID=2614577 RepID=A0A9P7ZH45_9HYPO|nr:uncharacterized protein F5Z01DRAFT_271896 [Emericellopsis atlantica]KAG9251601.1 hypothetical protein F5Z01DRAFT_271896 [Emericellopsis atlantica]